jgi:hypothetical protein
MADRDWGDRGGREWDRDRDDERFGRGRGSGGGSQGGYGGGSQGGYGGGSQGGYGGDDDWSSRGFGSSSQRGYNREATGAQEWNRGWGSGAGGDWNRGGMSSGQGGYGNQQGGFRGSQSGFGGESGGGGFRGGYGSQAGGFYGQGSGEFGGRGSEQHHWSGSDFGGTPSQEGQRGRFTGRGPKGWKRSNERISEEVNEALARHPDVDASDIEVRVENGEVTLTGVVEDRGQKRLAEDIAEDVFGVDDVNNDLKIRHGFLAGLTGEKADEREVTRGAEREPSSTAGGRSTSPRGRTSGRSELSDR